MDPLSLVIFGALFGGIKLAKDGQEEERQIASGELPLSYKIRDAVREARANSPGGILSAHDYARLYNGLGTSPGVMALAANQYRNAKAAADRRAAQRFDEWEQGTADPDYARRQQEAKDKAKADARQRREEFARRVREGATAGWGATRRRGAAAGGRARDTWGAFTDWLRPTPNTGEEAPEPEATGPDSETPGPNPAPDGADGADGPNTGGGGAPGPGPNPKPEPEPEPGKPEGESGGGHWWNPFNRNRPNGEKPAPENWRAEPVDEPPPYNPEPTGPDIHDADFTDYTPGELTTGRRSLDPAPAPDGPNPGEDPTGPPAPGGGGAPALAPGGAPTLTAPRPQLRTVPETERTPTMADTKNGLTPTNGTAPARSSGNGLSAVGGGGNNPAPAQARGNVAASQRRQQSSQARLGQIAEELANDVETVLAASARIRANNQKLIAYRAGGRLTSLLSTWVGNLNRDAGLGSQIANYLRNANIVIGGAAKEYDEAPKDLETYG